MKRIGITGINGFVGYHLAQTLLLYPDKYTIVQFDRAYFEKDAELDEFVMSCDVIVHLAALNRHNDPDEIYATNIGLVQKLLSSLNRTVAKPHILISSSTQEERDNEYGKSKKEARQLLASWASAAQAKFTGLIIPNVYGPFGHPNYNSVVATFCHRIARNEKPEIQIDGQLKLIYVGELVDEIINSIESEKNNPEYLLAHTAELKVSDILEKLISYKNTYQDGGEIPVIANQFEHNLFNTYRCYMDIPTYFPRKFVQHTDDRGAFVEIIRTGIGGQSSFSTTVPGITRGNHYHTRKIERFAVIKGKALIQLRKIGSDVTLNFYLDGNEPAYVDMPIWYTHNIKNIGDEVLYTNFWINEPYNPEDPDTWMEEV